MLIRNTLALTAAYVLVMTLPNVLPLFVGAVMKALVLDEQRAGMLLTAELVTLALTPAVLARFAPRLPLRAVLLAGAGVAVLGHICAMTVHGFGFLLATRVLAGFGVGLIFLAVNRAAALVADPVRLYGIMNSAGIVTALVIFAIAPHIVIPYGLVGAYGILAILTILALPVIAILRWQDLDPGEAIADQPGNIPGRRVLLLSCGVLAICCSYMALYSFSQPIAANAGLSAVGTASLLVAVQVFSLVATVAASWLGLRFGLMKPLSIMLVTCVVLSAVTVNTTSVTVFVAAYLVMNFCFLFTMSYQLGVGAVLDASGRLAAVGGGIFYLGAALSPLVGGYLITHFGYASIAVGIAVGVLVGLGAFRLLLSDQPIGSRQHGG